MASKKRVVAHFMHEHEEAEARRVLDDAEVEPAFVVGVTDDEGVRTLQAAGLFVEVLGRVAPALPDPQIAAGPALRFPALVQARLRGPLTSRHRSEIATTGATIVERTPEGAVVMRVDAAKQLAALRDLGVVERVEPAERSGPVMKQRARAIPTDPTIASADVVAPVAADDPALTYDVRLREPGALSAVKQWLEKQPGTVIVDQAKRKLRAVLRASVAAEVSGREDVAKVSEVIPRRVRNDVACALTGAVSPRARLGAALFDLDGSGEIVAIADTGLDETHPELPAWKVVGVEKLGRRRENGRLVGDDPDGHGTHVAGTAVGSGGGSDGELAGAAPGAKLYFQSLLDRWGELGGLPTSLEDLFATAYAKGARIHSNSWGAALAGRYGVDSLEVDQFVYEHPEMLVVVAAGNEGSLRPPSGGVSQTPPGFVELFSIGDPATSKNALVVGASRSSRARGGYARFTHHEAWPDDFPLVPGFVGVANEKISSDPQALAGFSSRGPSDDGRVKPDIVAPGTDILSARSAKAPSSHFWGTSRRYGGRYAYMGGTSMATPLVAGCAAVVRQYIRQVRHHDLPSAALLKATLLNGARWLAAPDSIADPQGEPNYHQGFGCLQLHGTLPHRHADFELAFVDTHTDAGLALAGGRAHQWRVSLTSPGPLRICMSYTDPPGAGIQHDLDLFVELSDGSKLRGNDRVPLQQFVNRPDRANNTEVIRVPNAPAGKVLVQVTARNVIVGPQHYALTITGPLDETLGAPPAAGGPRTHTNESIVRVE